MSSTTPDTYTHLIWLGGQRHQKRRQRSINATPLGLRGKYAFQLELFLNEDAKVVSSTDTVSHHIVLVIFHLLHVYCSGVSCVRDVAPPGMEPELDPTQVKEFGEGRRINQALEAAFDADVSVLSAVSSSVL